MKTHIATKLITSPWNLDPLRARTLVGKMVSALLKNERPAEDVAGDPLPRMQVVGPIAVIPICGLILCDCPDWILQWFDCNDANDIEEEITEALNNDSVQMIVFNVDSPGGLAIAGDKLFSVVDAANQRKPCFAFCSDGSDMCSTAYEAVASCREIRCGYFADGIGCIGSYLAYLDDTEFWQQMGITFEVFRSGELKGIGESVPLTQAQKDFLQSTVDYFGDNIRRNVSKYRTMISADDMKGQWFDGRQAAQRGFVAGCEKNLDAAIRKFQGALG